MKFRVKQPGTIELKRGDIITSSCADSEYFTEGILPFDPRDNNAEETIFASVPQEQRPFAGDDLLARSVWRIFYPSEIKTINGIPVEVE